MNILQPKTREFELLRALYTSTQVTDIFMEYAKTKKIEITDVYSDAYNISFGQVGTSAPTYKTAMEKLLGKVSGLTIGELFGGQGFELESLRRLCKNNLYVSLDIDHTYHPNDYPISYETFDVIHGDPNQLLDKYGQFDFILCGVTNISHSVIQTIEDFRDHLNLMKQVIKPGGILLISTQNIPSDQFTLLPHFSTAPVLYGVHAGKFCHWSMITEVHTEKDTCAYSSLIALSNSEDPSDLEAYENVWFIPASSCGPFKNWTDQSVNDIAKYCGFEKIPESVADYETLFRVPLT